MTPELRAAVRRARAFLAAWDERHTTRDQVLAQAKPGSSDMLTSDDLRALLAAVDQLAAAVERTTAQMREYDNHGSLTVNIRQVINLLSPTWPDGNYTAPESRYRPLTDEPCGVIPTKAGRRLIDEYRAHRTQQHPKER